MTFATRGSQLSEAARWAEKEGVRIVPFAASWPNAMFFSYAMLRGLGEYVTAADLVHVHSQWTFPVWWGSYLAIRHGKPLVISPQGCLDPARLRHRAWKKRLAGVFDRRCLRRAQVLHATCEAEAEGIRTYLGAKGAASIAVVANGVDLRAPTFRDTAEKTGQNRMKTALYLGRLHALKGLDLLLDAWGLVARESSAWHLTICGQDEQGTLARLRAQAHRLGLQDRVSFPGPVYSDEKTRMLRDAHILVLPSRNENFGMVVAEALACGVPVITTKGAPWKDLLGEAGSGKREAGEGVSRGRCGWWVDIGVEPLAAALREAMRITDEERQAMGENGRRLVEAKYTWDRVARQMEEVYRQAMVGVGANSHNA